MLEAKFNRALFPGVESGGEGLALAEIFSRPVF